MNDLVNTLTTIVSVPPARVKVISPAPPRSEGRVIDATLPFMMNCAAVAALPCGTSITPPVRLRPPLEARTTLPPVPATKTPNDKAPLLVMVCAYAAGAPNRQATSAAAGEDRKKKKYLFN